MVTYRRSSWVDARIQIQVSPLGGKGMFARAPINAGEVVVICGGKLFTNEEVKAGKTRKGSIAVIDEGL